MGTHKLSVRGLVPPSLVEAVRGGITGIVNEDGKVEIDNDLETTLNPVDSNGNPDPLEPGDEVKIYLRQGNLRCKTIDQQVRERNKREERKEQRKRRRREEAEEFWDSFDIPFEYDVAIKPRISGLQRGSDGTGHAANTVRHLHVKEPFDHHRLSRGEDTYLCDGDYIHPNGDGERRIGDSGKFMPKVTCKKCLKRMDRWSKGG